MAPEVLKGEPVSPLSDVWSLAITAIEMGPAKSLSSLNPTSEVRKSVSAQLFPLVFNISYVSGGGVELILIS